jgi:hypothetical protein
VNFELVAKSVSLCEDDETLVLAFGDDEPGVARYLMLQHALSPQEQDIQLGLDGLYIECDDHKYGCYAGVQAIRRIHNRIEIELTGHGMRKLCADKIIFTPTPWTPIVDQGLHALKLCHKVSMLSLMLWIDFYE